MAGTIPAVTAASEAEEAPARLRAICLGFPEATEKPMKRGPTYRVCDKIFAMDRIWEHRASVWCKVSAGSQQILIGADAARFFAPRRKAGSASGSTKIATGAKSRPCCVAAID